MHPFPVQTESLVVPPVSIHQRAVAAYDGMTRGVGRPDWIRLREREDVLVDAKHVDERIQSGEHPPLAGATVATAETGEHVSRLVQAGAIVLGYVDAAGADRLAQDPMLGALDAVWTPGWPQRCGTHVVFRPTAGLVPGRSGSQVIARDVAMAQRTAAALAGPGSAGAGARTWPEGVRFGAGEHPRIAVPDLDRAEHPAFAATVDTLRATGASVSAIDLPASLRRWTRRGARPLDGVDAVVTPMSGLEPTAATLVGTLDVAATAVADRGVAELAVLTAAFDDQIALDVVAQLTGVAADEPFPDTGVELVVFGAYLRGQPLNDRLISIGARFAGVAETAPHYRMVVLPGRPAQPGVVRTAAGGGLLVGERWIVSEAGLGRFLAGLAEPMALGGIDLAEGRTATGLLCDPVAASAGRDITDYRCWRAYLRQLSTRTVRRPTANGPIRRPGCG